MDHLDELIRDEAPAQASAVAIIDAPALVEHALTLTPDVRVWCDDWRQAQQVDQNLLVEHPDDLAGVDLALGHLPKSLGALDEQAAAIQGAPDVTFLTGARVRHMNRSMNEVLAQHFTAVSATRGRGKSRALRAFGPEGRESAWPKVRHNDALDLEIAAHGATFNGPKLDAGTRLLVANLDVAGQDVLDLGSGNGIIAAHLAREGYVVSARDVSWSAVASTMETAAANDVDVDATWGDGLMGYDDEAFDAIVTNPPFHQGIAKESEPTLEMFSEAARVLRPGGQLWSVYNSHLPWRHELATRLGETRVVAQDPRYTVTLTVRR